MQVLTVLGACVLVSLAAGETLRFIPKYGKVSSFRQDDAKNLKWPPKFCNGLKCPKYSVVKSESVEGKFEVREYEQSQWVSTNVAGVDYSSATRTDFGRLFKYISGANEGKQKIEMTAPVITKLIPGQGPACENNFTMSFYVAIENPPQATDNKVFLTTLPPLRAYVRSFPGYYMSDIEPWIKEAEKLAKYLKEAGYSYKEDFYYIGGYDSPLRFLDRHNEVWFLA